MARQVTVTIDNLGGGVDDNLRPNEISPSKSPTTARNIRLDGNSKRPREGYTTYADTLTSGTKIQGMAGYRRSLKANDRLVIAYKSTLYDIDVDNETSWSELTTTLTSDSRTEFMNYRDWLLVMNGVDEMGRLEGTSYSEPATKPASLGAGEFLPAFGAVFQNASWVSGVPTAPNTVFISKPALTDAPEDVYDFSGAIGGGAAEESLMPTRCTAIRLMSTIIVAFTTDEAYYTDGFKDLGSSIVPNTQPVGGASGAVSQSTTVTVENDIFYLTPQKEIKSIRRGLDQSLLAQVNPISDDIKNFLVKNLDDDQSGGFSYYDQANKLVKFFLKSEGSSFNNIRIVGDIKKIDQNGVPQWLIDDAMVFNAGTFYNSKAYIGSSVIGQVYEDEVGLADDDNVNIITGFPTKDFTANNPTVEKRFKTVRIFGLITEATELEVKILVDCCEVQTITINSDDITSSEQGGVAAQTIGEYAVADDDIVGDQLQEFVKKIPIRRSGKKIRIEFSTDGINNDYRVSYLEYSFIALNRLLNKASETN